MADNIEKQAALFAGYSAEIQEQIVKELVEFYGQGATLRDIINLQISDEILEGLGYADAVDGLLADYDKIARQVNGEVIFQAVPDVAKEALKGIDQQFYFSRVGEVSNELKRAMVQAVISDVPQSALRNQLLSASNALSKPQVETVVNTALRTNSRVVFSAATEELPAETPVLFAGPPPIPTSHDFCKEWAGQETTLGEAKVLLNQDGDSAWTAGGGWNCRHRWEIVVD